MSALSPSYKDCDNIISDIYALTQTARMRRRAELGLDKYRTGSELKDESLSPKCLPRPNISNIQNRPLPQPGTLYNRQSDHIYHSPVRMAPVMNRRPQEHHHQFSRQRQTSNIPTAKYHHPVGSRIPLAVSPPQPSIIPAHQRPRGNMGHVDTRAPPLRPDTGGHGQRLGLGARAVTELDFSRCRQPIQGVSNVVTNHVMRPPSVTGTGSEHSTTTCSTSGPSPSLLDSNDSCVRKGVMWVQQEKIFSRWKERFIILTSSYLHIFKKSTSRISDMGTFVNKIRLSEIDNLSIEERKGYLTMVLTTSRDSRLLLRKTEGIREWQRSIETLLAKEKQKHREMQSTNDFWNRKQFSDCHNAASQWLLVRDNIGHKYGYLSRMSPNNFHSETEDSGFESLVTVTSDSSSNSSRMVSPHPPVNNLPSNNLHLTRNMPSNPAQHIYERSNYQYYNFHRK